MTNVEIIEVNTSAGLEEHVVIDNGDGTFVSMPKSVYDEQQAALKDAAN